MTSDANFQEVGGLAARKKVELASLPTDVAWMSHRGHPQNGPLRGVPGGVARARTMSASAGALTPTRANRARFRWIRATASLGSAVSIATGYAPAACAAGTGSPRMALMFRYVSCALRCGHGTGPPFGTGSSSGFTTRTRAPRG